MRIAVVVHSLDGIGGVSKHALTLAREFVSLGHETDVWAVEYNRKQCYPELTEHLSVNALRDARRRQSTTPNWPFGLRMLRYLAELTALDRDQRRLAARMPPGYDLINPHGYGAHWAAVAYKRVHHTPVVWLSNDFCPIAHYDTARANGPWTALTTNAKAGLTRYFARYDQRAAQEIDRILVLNQRVQSQIAQHYHAVSDIVRTGVDVELFTSSDGAHIRQQHAIPDGAFVLLTVAMLMPRRRIEDVIEAVRRLRARGADVYYLLVGRTSYDEAYTATLRRMVSDYTLADRVIFVGEVSESALVDYYHACDAFIWAADENQSWGMAALEAMAAGKALIVSEANGIAEMVIAGQNALTFPARDASAIGATVERLINEPGMAKLIGQQGQTLVREHFSWRRNAETIISIFETAVTPVKTHFSRNPQPQSVDL